MIRYRDMTEEQRARHRERMNKYNAEHREERKEYIRKYRAEHPEEWRERTRKYRAEHSEEIKERRHKNRAKRRECRRKRYAEHGEEIRKRNQSRSYLLSKHTKLPGYEIHHAFGYDDYTKFIYIPKELNLQIHKLLRELKIPADTNHWMAIRDLVNSYEEYTYISV